MEPHWEGSMSFLVSLCGMYNTLAQVAVVIPLFSWRGRYYDSSAKDLQETYIEKLLLWLHWTSPRSRLEITMLAQAVYLGSEGNTSKVGEVL